MVIRWRSMVMVLARGAESHLATLVKVRGLEAATRSPLMGMAPALGGESHSLLWAMAPARARANRWQPVGTVPVREAGNRFASSGKERVRVTASHFENGQRPGKSGY